jgi:hypothetical protein
MHNSPNVAPAALLRAPDLSASAKLIWLLMRLRVGVDQATVPGAGTERFITQDRPKGAC